jgi:hypothetical protein
MVSASRISGSASLSIVNAPMSEIHRALNAKEM